MPADRKGIHRAVAQQNVGRDGDPARLIEAEAIDKDVGGYQQKDDGVRACKKRSIDLTTIHADQPPE
jgi:hypothetical protein